MIVEATAITIQVHIVAFINFLCKTLIDDVLVPVDHLFLTIREQNIFILTKMVKRWCLMSTPLQRKANNAR